MTHNNNKTLDIDVVLIDNFDSFTYNLVNQMTPLVNRVAIYRNNVSLNKISETIECSKKPVIIVISPGPGTPNEAGITLEVIKTYQDKVPILGICLGHQAIVQSFGGTIGFAKSVMHGKTSAIKLNLSDSSRSKLNLSERHQSKQNKSQPAQADFNSDQSTLFNNLSSPLRVARYHSLAAARVPTELIVIAQVDDEIMAVKHVSKKILGYQFHPESILTTNGDQLMKNSLSWLMGKEL